MPVSNYRQEIGVGVPPASRPDASAHADGWVPADGSAEVGGLAIGGSVYVGDSAEAAEDGSLLRCLIDPSLPVATRAPSDTAQFFSYSPTYAELSPIERRAYLQWLASGRSDPFVATPCVRLYFLGLERRLLAAGTGRPERLRLFAEVRRLRGVYGGDDEDLDHELAQLLDIAPIFDPDAFVPDPREYANGRDPGMSLPLALGLGRKLRNSEAIEGDWLLSWWLCVRDSKALKPPRRCFDEFAQLFEARLARQYPNGYRVRCPERRLSVEYRSATGEYTRCFDEDLAWCPDVRRLVRPPKLAEKIAAECLRDLEPFCRYIQRKPARQQAVEAQLLLPFDIAGGRESGVLEALRAWADDRIREREGAARVGELLELCEGERPKAVLPLKMRRAAQALRLVAVGIAPDPEIHDRILAPADPVCLYRLSGPEREPVRVTARYQLSLTVLSSGVYVAQAGGGVSDAARHLLEGFVERRTGLRPAERDLLRADLGWLVRRKQSLLSLRKQCVDGPSALLEEVREMAVAVASAAGLPQAAQVIAVQKLYRLTGRPGEAAIRALHRVSAGTAALPGPDVEAGDPMADASFALRGDAPSLPVELDAERVSAIVADTRMASSVLSEVFDDSSSNGAACLCDGQPVAYEGLDAAHGALVSRIVERPRWTEAEFEAVAGQFGLMPGGSLEAVNEWSFERFGEALLDMDGDLVVNEDAARELRDERGAGSNAAA